MNNNRKLLTSLVLLAWMWGTVAIAVLATISANSSLAGLMPGVLLDLRELVSAFFTATAAPSY